MSLLVLGLNHKSAPVEVREQLAHLNSMAVPYADGTSLEAVTICTCNRVEIYYAGEMKTIIKSLAQIMTRQKIDMGKLNGCFYKHKDKEAVRHLFYVAGGIDSMILGENQILHQIKEAYKDAVTSGLVGKRLHNLFQRALEVGKKVRTRTAISENRVSVASAAVDLARSIFPDLSALNAVLIGAGEMANLVAVHMHENGVKNMTFLNRTKCRALELSKKFNGNACSIDKLNQLLETCDILVSSTSAPHQIIRAPQIQEVMKKRSSKPLFMIDIAVPRDIESQCRQIENVFLYDVDDLEHVVSESLSQRREEAIKAEKIINLEVSDFMALTATYIYADEIKALSEKANNIRVTELNRFLAHNSDLSNEIQEELKEFSRKLMGKWLHNQIEKIKSNKISKTDNFSNFAEVIGLSQKTVTHLKERAMRTKGSERELA